LVRASGSYPLCPGFKSLHRHQISPQENSSASAESVITGPDSTLWYGFTLEVTDMVTGVGQRYNNAPGRDDHRGHQRIPARTEVFEKGIRYFSTDPKVSDGTAR
jgi:hypothetical protein